MSQDNTDSNSSDVSRGAGEAFWLRGSTGNKPVLVKQGIVGYRRGGVAIGLLGPGQIALPVPGVPGAEEAVTDLVAVTAASVTELAGGGISADQALGSAVSIVEGADRLGNLTLPRRLAALMLEVCEKTGQNVVGCRQDVLAMAVGARRETVATVLSGWREEDWIQTRYRRVKVLNKEILAKIRDGDGEAEAED